MGWIHLDLTMATTAALPILLGLGVDYMVQFHNRYEEEAARGDGVDALDHALDSALSDPEFVALNQQGDGLFAEGVQDILLRPLD